MAGVVAGVVAGGVVAGVVAGGVAGIIGCTGLDPPGSAGVIVRVVPLSGISSSPRSLCQHAISPSGSRDKRTLGKACSWLRIVRIRQRCRRAWRDDDCTLGC